MTDPAKLAARKQLLSELIAMDADAREQFFNSAAIDQSEQKELRELLRYAQTQDTPFAAVNAQAVNWSETQANYTGSQLGPWTLQERIGRGGVGEVYAAQRSDGAFSGKVAVKLLSSHLLRPDVISRFRAEQQHLAGLNHPNIARLYDAGIHSDGTPYFVMELVSGKSLDEAADALNFRARIELFLQLTDAVAYAHRNLVVHRDLKPSNVMVNAEGQVKLLDFGIAKALGDEVAGDSGQTGPGQRFYTPRYATPEQVQGMPVSTATDVYALGLILYEMLTGRMPYAQEGEAAAQVANAAVISEALRPSRMANTPLGHQWPAFKRALRGDLENVILKTLEKNPESRYASVDAFADDLRRYLSRRPVQAKPPTTWQRMSKFVLRNRALVAASTLAVLSLITATTWALRAAAQAKRAQLEAESRVAEIRAVIGDVAMEQADLLNNIPEGKEVRAKTLEIALEKLETLQKEFPDDQGLAADRASLLVRLANVQYFPNGISLNLPQEARRSRARAEAIFASLGDAAYDDPTNIVGRARIFQLEGEALRAQGKPDLALASQERGIHIIETGAKRYPNNRQILSELSHDYIAMGQLHSTFGADLGAPEKSLQYLYKAQVIQERLLGMDKGKDLVDTIHNISATLGAIAIAFGNQDQLAQAIDAIKLSIAREDEAHRLTPANTLYAQQAGVARNNYFNFLIDAGRASEGVVDVPKMLAIADELIKAEPGNPTHVVNRYRQIIAAGHLLWMSGERERARPLLAEGEAGITRFMADKPTAELIRRRGRARLLLASYLPTDAARSLINAAISDTEQAVAGGLKDRNSYMQLSRCALALTNLAGRSKMQRAVDVRRGLEWIAQAKANKPLLPTQLETEKALLGFVAP
jgi:eukaryotic-like serine/threonine-protein kinase